MVLSELAQEGETVRLEAMPIQQDFFEQCAMFPAASRHSASTAMQGYNLPTPAFTHNSMSSSPGQHTPAYTGQDFGQFQVGDATMMQQSPGSNFWSNMYTPTTMSSGRAGMTTTGHMDEWSGFVGQTQATNQDHYPSYRNTLSSSGGSPMPTDYIPNTQPASSTIMTLTGSTNPGATTSNMTANNAAVSRQSRPPYDWMKKQSYPTTPSAGKTRTKDKYRVVYSDHQRLELEKEFHYSRYITIRRKAELAQNLQLSERQVKIWFQNRRAKERKMNKKKENMGALIKTDISTHMHESPDLSPAQI